MIETFISRPPGPLTRLMFNAKEEPPWWPRDVDFSSKLFKTRPATAAVYLALQQHQEAE